MSLRSEGREFVYGNRFDPFEGIRTIRPHLTVIRLRRVSDDRSENTGEVVTLMPEGDRFNYGEAIKLCDAIAEHLQMGCKHFLIRSHKLKDISLPAVALLVEQIREVTRFNGELVFEGLSGRALAVFEIYHLDNLVKKAG